MKKSLYTFAAIALLGGITLAWGQTETTSALNAERITNSGSVRWITDEQFIITSIKPSDGQISMVYTDVDNLGLRITNTNIVWEKEDGAGDMFVHKLVDDRPDWAQTVYNRETRGTAFFVSTYEQTFAMPETDLSENTSGILYYYEIIDDNLDNSLFGKVDYSMCLNSPLYEDDVECRLEVTDEGYAIYHPYLNGERLEELGSGDLDDEDNEIASSDVKEDEYENNVDLLERREVSSVTTEQNVKNTNNVSNISTKSETVKTTTTVNTEKTKTGTDNSENDANLNEKDNVTIAPLGTVGNAEQQTETKSQIWKFLVISCLTLGAIGLLILFIKKRHEKKKEDKKFVI